MKETLNNKLPSCLDEYVISYFKSRPIWYLEYDGISVYCPNCLDEIGFDCLCPNCNINYKFNSKELENMLLLDYINLNEYDETNIKNYCLFYFDVEFDHVILYMIYYVIKIDVTHFYESSKISFSLQRKKIKKFFIEKDGVYLPNGSFYSFDIFSSKYEIKNNNCEKLIYKDNLDILKNTTLYRHSNLWELKDMFNITENHQPNLNNLVIHPLLHPEFEYLIKLGFYSMALIETDKIKFNHNFKDTINIKKSKLKNYDYRFLLLKHLKVLSKININSKKNLIKLFFQFDNMLNSELALSYITKNKLKTKDIFNYLDYLNLCCRFAFNHNIDYEELIKDNNSIFYPRNYRNRKKEFYSFFKSEIKKINNWYEKAYNILRINCYEDDEYIIRPLKNLDDLFNEAKSQHNCLELYIDFDCKGSHQIYFMRKKDNPRESFITIEIRDNHIYQARAKFNKEPEDKIKKILKIWESKLIKVEFER